MPIHSFFIPLRKNLKAFRHECKDYVYQGSKKEQLQFFNRQLRAYFGMPYPYVDNWFDAFEQLKHYISGVKKSRVVIFIDELPWLDTPRSRFTKAKIKVTNQ